MYPYICSITNTYTPLLGQPKHIIFHNCCITIIRDILASYYGYTMRYPTDNSVNSYTAKVQEKPRGGVYVVFSCMIMVTVKYKEL